MSSTDASLPNDGGRLLKDGVKLAFGRFEIVKIISDTGRFQIYRARDHKTNRDVAIKLASSGDRQPARTERMERECIALSAISQSAPNPFVVSCDPSLYHTDDLVYLVMEYLEGISLDKRDQLPDLSDRDIYYLAEPMLRGLDATHVAGVTHRDIKPGNFVKLDGHDYKTKLIDFESAIPPGLGIPIRILESAHGERLGSPFYLPPELVIGRNEENRSDLFSLAVSLFELLTGEHPLISPTEWHALKKHYSREIHYAKLCQTPRSANAIVSSVPKDWDLFFAPAFKSNPKHRHQNAIMMFEDLQEMVGTCYA